MRRRLIHATHALLVMVLCTWALALLPVPTVGLELVLTDDQARGLVGYGVVSADGLQLQLSLERAQVQVLVVDPQGRSSSYQGELADGRMWLLDAGVWRDLATVLDQAGLGLWLDYGQGRLLQVMPAPGSRPPSQGGSQEERDPVRSPPAGDDDDDDGDDDQDDGPVNDDDDDEPVDDPPEDDDDDGDDDRDDDQDDDQDDDDDD